MTGKFDMRSVTRRQCNFMSLGLLGSMLIVPASLASTTKKATSGPILWRAERQSSRVTILGFGEASDESWLSPELRTAFERSSQLWLESAGPDDQPKPTADTLQRMETLGRQTDGTLFSLLDAPTRDRLTIRIKKLGLPASEIEGLRPWRAYYNVIGAYFRLHPKPQPPPPDRTLAAMAKEANKEIGFEMPTAESFVEFMAAMPEDAQREYIRWLLDFIDDLEQGKPDDKERYAWMKGEQPPSRSLQRMIAMPALYEAMQTRRNQWWAAKIDELLSLPGEYFVAVGQLHTLGPGAIQAQLRAKGVPITRADA